MHWIDVFEDRDITRSCECGNEPSVSIRCGEFLAELRTCQLLKKDCAPYGYTQPIKTHCDLMLLLASYSTGDGH